MDGMLFWRVEDIRGKTRFINMEDISSISLASDDGYIAIKMGNSDFIQLYNTPKKREMLNDILVKASNPARHRPHTAPQKVEIQPVKDGDGRSVFPTREPIRVNVNFPWWVDSLYYRINGKIIRIRHTPYQIKEKIKRKLRK